LHNENEVVKMISLISKQMTPLEIAPNLIYVTARWQGELKKTMTYDTGNPGLGFGQAQY
jgi:hypothetical protein